MLFVLQYMKREISDLRSRVTILEQEKKAAIAGITSCYSVDNITIDRKRSRTHHDGASIKSEKIVDICEFCSPRRCRTCDKRISMIPSIITLLVTNDFIGAKELGVLACVGAMMHRLICEGDSDDEIWSHLLRTRWPSTIMIPSNVLSGLSHRAWYERMATARLPGLAHLSEICHNTEMVQRDKRRRDEIRQRLLSTGENEGEFPLLPEPSLQLGDVMFLVDMFYDNHPFASAASRVDVQQNNVPTIHHNDRLELELWHNGTFVFKESHIDGTINAVRLTDYKIICLIDNFSGETTLSNQELDGSLARGGLRKTDIVPYGLCHSLSYDPIGYNPNEFNARIGDEEDWCQGFHFELRGPKIILPRSPYYFGYEYTVSKYQAFIRSNTDNPLSFDMYRRYLWHGGNTKPELARFFDEVMKMESKDGKYYGTICAEQEEFHISTYVELSESSRVPLCDAGLQNVGLLDVLVDLFERTTEKQSSVVSRES